jgi:hypothetical protein
MSGTSFVDPHHIDADPDPACHFDPDPDLLVTLMQIRMRIRSLTPVVHLELRISPRISKKFEMVLMGYSGAWGKLIHEKTRSRNDSVPLRCTTVVVDNGANKKNLYPKMYKKNLNTLE